MKYYKTLNLYKASNNEFNPKTMTAKSYGWWEYVKPIKGKLVFNNYGYSNTTRRHQHKMAQLMANLGLEREVIVECPNGLQELSSGLAYYDNEIKKLRELIDSPRTKAAKNEERIERMAHFIKRKNILKGLMK